MISCMICGFSCDILAVSLRRAFRKTRCTTAAAGPHVSHCVLLHSTQKTGSKVRSPAVRMRCWMNRDTVQAPYHISIIVNQPHNGRGRHQLQKLAKPVWVNRNRPDIWIDIQHDKRQLVLVMLTRVFKNPPFFSLSQAALSRINS